MFNKVKQMCDRYESVMHEISDPDLICKNKDKYINLSKELSSLQEVYLLYSEYIAIQNLLEESHDEELEKERSSLESKIKSILIPQNLETQTTILEIRSGVGGEDACYFCEDLMTMYLRFCNRNILKTSVLNTNYKNGLLREVVVSIDGKGAYDKLRHESGVHRTQRVPYTEAKGRMHTSTCTVAVLPPVEDIAININESDLHITTFIGSGPGGQHRNKTDSAVRILHKPSGVVAICQSGRPQHINKMAAMDVLMSRLNGAEQSRLDDERHEDRKAQVGMGDRAEKVRTYNFPQNMCKDERVGKKFSLDKILAGELDDLIDALYVI